METKSILDLRPTELFVFVNIPGKQYQYLGEAPGNDHEIRIMNTGSKQIHVLPKRAFEVLVRLKPNVMLRKLREATSYSARDVSKFLGIHEDTVSSWECGKHRFPRTRAQELATIYGVSPDHIIENCVSSSRGKYST